MKLFVSKFWRYSVAFFYFIIFVSWVWALIISFRWGVSDYLENLLYISILPLLLTVYMGGIIWAVRRQCGYVVIDSSTMKSFVFNRVACTIDRKQIIYYCLAKCKIHTSRTDVMMVLSNHPFTLGEKKYGVLTSWNFYDASRQIVLPYNDITLSLLYDTAIFLENNGCSKV